MRMTCIHQECLISDDSFLARLDLWTDWLEHLFPGSGPAFVEGIEEREDNDYGQNMDQDEYELLVAGCIDNFYDEDLPTSE